MNKILVEDSILQESTYMLDNHYKGKEDKISYMSIKGIIKFISFEKFKLEKEDVEDTIGEEYLNNTIGKLEIEYTNLNFLQNSDITNNFYLSDENGTKYETIVAYYEVQAIANHLNKDILDIHGYKFVPKIKTKVEIFYLIPNEETNYYFELNRGEITNL